MVVPNAARRGRNAGTTDEPPTPGRREGVGADLYTDRSHGLELRLGSRRGMVSALMFGPARRRQLCWKGEHELLVTPELVSGRLSWYRCDYCGILVPVYK